MKNVTNDTCDVRKFLESARAATFEVRRLQRRVDELAQRRGRLRIRRGAVAKKLTGMIDEERRRELELVKCELENYRRVEEFVARIPDSMHRTILRRRYLEPELSWADIHDRLEEEGVIYSERHLFRLHAQAVEAASKLWETEGEEGTVKKRR